ncbi:hypothetical protein B4O97_07150 [Marispirochaeta aestuarii]|uniref:Uncharacterized protein n=2 Tax=Marispirochaeta aestuarii TaxID=1963862 RepID=A0A1Y1RYU4_9SPIO|nr:hypothetical protein B4O97_07150 [Marispirochaeta aestuarii]
MLLILLFFFGCNTSPPDDGGITVYVAGYYDTGLSYTAAAYWTDDGTTITRVDLDVPTLKDSQATDIFITDSGSIYISGYYINASDIQVAVYWKDGVQSGDLSNPMTNSAQASGITVDSGGTVYVSGYYWNLSEYNASVYWTDDGSISETVLGSGINARATDIILDGSSVYVSGKTVNNYAAYWLDNSSGLAELDTTITSTAQGIFHDGTNVFIAGRYQSGTAAYWQTDSSTRTDLVSPGGHAYGIWVDDGSVYVTGDYFVSLTYGNRRATWWLDDSSPQAELVGEDSNYATSAYDITVDGSDIYVSGTQTTATVTEAIYWKNGAVVPLESGTESRANAIYLAQ